MKPIGLVDKLYWRRAGYTTHCFKRSGKQYVSLCGQHTIDRSSGQKTNRPPPLLRCARCDGAEATRRGKEESLPESPDWRIL